MLSTFRRVFNLWHWCFANDWINAWRTRGSYGSSVSKNDQMHFPQIWSIGYSSKIRWSLRFTPQYHQWENLRFLMVLVHRFDRGHWSTNALPNDRYCVTQTQGNVTDFQIQVDQTSSSGICVPQKSTWRLVHVVPTWQKYRSSDFQRVLGWTLQEIRKPWPYLDFQKHPYIPISHTYYNARENAFHICNYLTESLC